MVSSVLETAFPNLALSGYEITSPATDTYNCLAWAAGVTDCWWWPDPLGDMFWPMQAPRTTTIEAFVLAYQSLGYQICVESEWEPGFEKIALYAHPNGTPTHAARQLPSGQWTSKLGSLADIIHHTLEGVSGRLYGEVVQIMKRPYPD